MIRPDDLRRDEYMDFVNQLLIEKLSDKSATRFEQNVRHVSTSQFCKKLCQLIRLIPFCFEDFHARFLKSAQMNRRRCV